MAGRRRTGRGYGKGNWDRPAARKGVLSERWQPRACAARRRAVRGKWQRRGRFCAGFERTKACRGGATAERDLSRRNAGGVSHITRVTALGELTASIAHEI